tara:strand:+ start:1074 stop:1235 length:162 start_codon:yes stop_codon:yes gene_type:complete
MLCLNAFSAQQFAFMIKPDVLRGIDHWCHKESSADPAINNQAEEHNQVKGVFV